MSGELERAFTSGISFDASAIRGFTDVEKSDLLLFPDPSTLAVLPWRPSNGKVMRMYCDIKYPDGTSYEADTRSFLKKAVSDAKDMGLSAISDRSLNFIFLIPTSAASRSRSHTIGRDILI